MERPTADRVEAVYAVLHPHKPNTRGSAAWFRRELSNRVEVDVTPTTIHKWFTNGVPVDRLQAVDEVLTQLEAEANTKLDQARGTLGP